MLPQAMAALQRGLTMRAMASLINQALTQTTACQKPPHSCRARQQLLLMSKHSPACQARMQAPPAQLQTSRVQ